MPARNYKAQSDIAIKLEIILNNGAIWLVNAKPQNEQIHCRILPEESATHLVQ